MSVFRRIMLGGGIDIDTLPDTQKLYYQATAKVTPKSNSLGASLIVNKWDATTGEGVIVCSSDITTIGNDAFRSNTKITSITIPNNVISIGDYAFSYCSSLKSVTIPNSIKEINYRAFYNCSGLTGVYISDLSSWCSISNLNMMDIPLYYAKKLYLNNTLVEDLIIPNNITKILSNAFCNCESLKTVTIHGSVESIGNAAFYSCDFVEYYDFSTHNFVPIIDDFAFAYIPSTCKIIVPDALYDEWVVATDWVEYADRIIKKSDWDAQQITE